MCGICGVLGSWNPEIIKAMNQAMHHRGPDDDGVFIDNEKHVALGHRRLSVIDVSKCGHQPMSYAKGRYWITFNGEIYNYKDIRKQLENIGHRFETNSDTEVLLASYVQWDERCLDKLSGMFAFAIYDKEAHLPNETLIFLARDRLGIKPLYFSIKDRIISFSSEMKGMLASGLVSRKIDRQAVWHYLSLGSVPQPRTIFTEVKMLMPGHFMKISRSRDIKISRYWDIAINAGEEYRDIDKISAIEAHKHLRVLLENSVRQHMVADVPVGAFLSGGIDSTTVVGLMSRNSRERIRTFSVGFESKLNRYDERRWARIAAQIFETDHTEVIVNGEDVARQYDDIIRATDQPSLDGTNTYVISKAAGESVRVALSGLGGDEIFAGYPHFIRFINASRWDHRLSWLSTSLKKSLLNYFPDRLITDKKCLLLNREERYSTLRNLTNDFALEDITSTSLSSSLVPETLAEYYLPLLRSNLDVIAETSYVEINSYLVNTLLRDVDAMAMAHSLEVRPLLLDHKLAEFAFALPAQLKVSRRLNKPVLVGAVKDLIPDALIHRAKMGFELPLAEWLSGPLRDRAVDAFSLKLAKEMFSQEFLYNTKESLLAGQCSSIAIWSYFNLLAWIDANQGEL
jgi:asparagine synthase (glutamine-hydrolysing)